MYPPCKPDRKIFSEDKRAGAATIIFCVLMAVATGLAFYRVQSSAALSTNIVSLIEKGRQAIQAVTEFESVELANIKLPKISLPDLSFSFGASDHGSGQEELGSHDPNLQLQLATSNPTSDQGQLVQRSQFRRSQNQPRQELSSRFGSTSSCRSSNQFSGIVYDVRYQDRQGQWSTKQVARRVPISDRNLAACQR